MIEKVLRSFFRATPYFFFGVIFAWFLSGFWIHGTPSTLLIKIIVNRIIFLGFLGTIITLVVGIRIFNASKITILVECIANMIILIGCGMYIILQNIILSMAVNGAVKLLDFGLVWKLIAVLLLLMLVIIALILGGALVFFIFWVTPISELLFSFLGIESSLDYSEMFPYAMFLLNLIFLLIGTFAGVNLAGSLIL
ncbi:hypothetical protein [Dolichospermum sp. UHCC 0259]|uniref:hypothetical protein n=1 Tax=Dolichospermum sp. UHCC 0259 TaxID=2590010 RepID=UPI001445C689|nr:hypothetical protein [Dolichospermum sp. UHCC 0259]MTJ47153.1 hypothetical protein [Dolichospermum sp. UHCC 0259]